MDKTLIINLILFSILLATNIVTTNNCIPKSITTKQCQTSLYNYTTANPINNSNIQSQINKFNSMINTECHLKIIELLCSAHVPFCDINRHIEMGICGSVCETIKTKCEPLVKSANLSWDYNLNCSRFPTENINGILCTFKKDWKNQYQPTPALTRHETINNYDWRKRNPRPGECHHLINNEKYIFINRTGRCALRCKENDLFSKQSKRVAEIWMTIIASLTFLSTLFTCLTFVHSDRIRYPEQPIIFLTFSYNIYSISLLLRIFFTRTKVSCDFDPVSGQKILIQEGLENTYCALTFLLNFFFSTATHMWWIILALCWTLYIGLNVSSTNLAKNSGIFHLFVWLMTSVLTVSVLILRSVDADELFGLCSVGEQIPELLLTFVIIPKTICLVVGLIFIGFGFGYSKYRTKKLNISRQAIYQLKTTSILSIGFRLGIFSIMYVVAIFVMISCEVYQYLNYRSWLSYSGFVETRSAPILALFLLKLFMGQIVGIYSVIWIWSQDAAGSWKKLFMKIVDTKHMQFSNKQQIRLTKDSQDS